MGTGTTSYCVHAGTTVPDPNSSSLHLGFPTEGEDVLCVLADFNILYHFPEGGAIMGSVFTDDSTFLVGLALSLQTGTELREQLYLHSKQHDPLFHACRTWY